MQYDGAYELENGVAVVKSDKEYMVINGDGNIIWGRKVVNYNNKDW